MRDVVAFRGKQSSLELDIAPGVSYEEARQAIVQKLEARRSFFAGSACVNIVGGNMREEEQRELKEILTKDFGMVHVEFGQIMPAVPQGQEHEIGFSPRRERTVLAEEGHEEPQERPLNLKSGLTTLRQGTAAFVRETVRNGQRVAFDGDIVVLGDVNFGAELVATGNIAVMGALRGMAHAGAAGDESAVVTAYRLQPQQLRIGALIAIAPAGEQQEVGYPEVARVRSGEISIEPVSRVIRP